MLLDRQEKHVLRELKTRYGIPTHKLASRIATREVSVVYDTVDTLLDYSSTTCYICTGTYEYLGVGCTTKSLKDKNSPKIGRMVAFARAVVDWYNKSYSKQLKLSGKEAEDMARGRQPDLVDYLDSLPVTVKEADANTYSPNRFLSLPMLEGCGCGGDYTLCRCNQELEEVEEVDTDTHSPKEHDCV